MQERHNPLNVWGVAYCEIVFPNPNNPPAEFAQLAVYAMVAGLVRGKFLFPKNTVASGNFAMFRATMPETAIHENRQSVPPKKKIRFAENLLIPPPAADVVLAEDS